RILAATNKNLEDLVARQLFRDDLFWRLNVIPITLPPLRDRLSDIPLLMAHFIARFNAEKKQRLTGVTPEALQMLQSYHWPGNVRELENTVERIAILKGIGMIMPADLPEKIARPSLSRIVPGVTIPDDGIDFDAMVEAFEKQLLMQALVKASGVKSKAANLLRMNRTTLVEKVKKLRLEND
ncbi:MAG TPA: helix-turn-helix domain-containing protein, partial [Candidatus Saccharimonadia bacterium]|nr:helix-turn-helix domain-containing protein [Candidatus Saccharimonadia bacterium]